MIILEKNGDKSVAHVNTTRPVIYLDQCVLNDLVKYPKCGMRFLGLLEQKNGTLLISWAHILESYALDPEGRTFKNLINYLEKVGMRFALIDPDAGKVLEKERSGNPCPALDVELIQIIFEGWDRKGTPSLAFAFDEVNSSNQDKWKEMHQEHKQAFTKLFENGRNLYKKNQQVKSNIDTQRENYEPGRSPLNNIYGNLIRETIKTHEKFNPSDGLDFQHVVVATAYSDIAVFDQKWARRLKKIGIPPESATVFNVTQRDEILDFLEIWKLSESG